MSRWSLPLLLLMVLLLPGLVMTPGARAQEGNLSALRQNLQRAEEAGRADSVAFYYGQLTSEYRKRDALGLWLDAYWDWQAFLFENSSAALACLDTAYQQQWRAPRTPAEWESLLWVEVNRGYHRFQCGQVLPAVEAYEEAEQVFRRRPPADFDAVEYIYKPLGSYYTMLGDNERARSVYERAMALALPGKDAEVLSGLYNNIGLTYWNEGNNPAAIRQYRLGLALAGTSPDKRGLLLSSLGRSLLETGDLSAATEATEEALGALLPQWKAGADRSVARYLASGYSLRGEIELANGQEAAARRNLETALDFSRQAFGNSRHRSSGKIYLALAQLELRAGRYPAAVEASHQALRCVIPAYQPRRWEDQPDPALFHEENTIFEALECKADALWGAYGSRQDTGLLRLSLDCHELAFRAETLLSRSYRFESAKLLLQAFRRRRTEKAIGMAYELYRRSGNPQYILEAFSTAERSRASLLLEAVRENLGRAELNRGDSLLIREVRLRQGYAFYERELLLAGSEEERRKYLVPKNELAGQLDALEVQIRNKYSRITAPDTLLPVAKLVDDLLVDPASVLLAYVVGREVIYGFRLSKGQPPRLQQFPFGAGQREQVNLFLEKFRSRQAISDNREGYLGLAYALYQMLVQPLIDVAGEPGRRIVFLTDDVLHFLPFEALVFAETPARRWEDVPFLINNATVQYGYSATVLHQLRAASAFAPKGLLGMAPVFAGRERRLPPLQFSEQELQQLPLAGRRLIGEQASLGAFRKWCPDYRLLHLSTHATADSTGLPPSIEFIDSTLYLPEIYALPLRAELVVLSACETGLGAFREGEGVMSLSRAFTYAGAASLVASLWKVNERSTAQLFRYFYQFLQEEVPRAEALTQAKRAYLNDQEVAGFLKSPYYWAGFVYYGNDTPLSFRPNPWWRRLWVYGLAGLLLVGWMSWRRFLRGNSQTGAG